jgi:hypothetical protein
MTHEDFVIENRQLLLSRWKSLNAGASPASLGFTALAATNLCELNGEQVARVADVHYPLFTLIPNEDVLANALDVQCQSSAPLDEDTFLFLINRWRAAAGSYHMAEIAYGLSRNMYDLLRNTSLPKIVAAASAGIDLVYLAVRGQYIKHAGARLDLEPSHRTRLAICASVKMGY